MTPAAVDALLGRLCSKHFDHDSQCEFGMGRDCQCYARLREEAAALIREQAAEIAELAAAIDANWVQHQRVIKAESALARAQQDAARWNAFVELWHASTELHATQDEDGRWSLTMVEDVEGMWTPGKWTGDTPDDAIAPLVAAIKDQK